MDEYLSEKEQIERIRQWWSDYGWYLLGGVLIGLLALFGYGRYQNTMDASAEQAAALYAELTAAVDDDDLDAVEGRLATLRSEYADSPYTANGALMLAKMVLVTDPDRAIAALRGVMEGSDDAELAMVARLRLARVLAWQMQYDAALELLDVEEPGAFAARLYDIRGDILLASGDTDGAQAAFASAMVMPGSEALDRNYLQMKLSSLFEAGAGEAAVMPEAMPEVDLGAAAQASDAAAEPAPSGAGAVQESDDTAEPAAADGGAAQTPAESAASAPAEQPGEGAAQ